VSNHSLLEGTDRITADQIVGQAGLRRLTGYHLIQKNDVVVFWLKGWLILRVPSY